MRSIPDEELNQRTNFEAKHPRLRLDEIMRKEKVRDGEGDSAIFLADCYSNLFELNKNNSRTRRYVNRDATI